MLTRQEVQGLMHYHNFSNDIPEISYSDIFFGNIDVGHDEAPFMHVNYGNNDDYWDGYW